MPEDVPEKPKEKKLTKSEEASLEPTAEEIGVLYPTERAGFKLARAMNFGEWKRFWTFCQRHIGSLWIYIATYNLMNVFGIENIQDSDPNRPLLLVANHRSFFDLYTVSSVMFRRTTRPIKLYFPVRAKFFYDRPLGWFVNLVMGWWSMYPPFFREEGEGEKRKFDKFSLRELTRLAAGGHGHVIGFHPEGKRNLNDDPYSFLPAQPGIGKVILNAEPQVIPVFIAGLGNDLPKQILGNWRGGEKVRIWFGEPLNLSPFHGKRDSLRTHKEIADFLMSKIVELGDKDREWIANRS
jgi:1-acyl-sn-glycerol-3-phosphate acyltransferase